MISVVHSALTLAICMTTIAALSAAVSFLSTFKSLDAGAANFGGKKVAALVISNDLALRMSGEEAMVRELNARGMQAVATYRIVPKEELTRAESAKPWFEKYGVEGVVVIRPVSRETRTAYTSGTWMSPNYSTFWSYYGYGWGSVYIPGSAQRETAVVVESTIHSVSRNQLLWAAVTESTNPRDMQAFIEELAKETVKEMQKQGLARSQPKGGKKN
jgi:hypothetical protein